VLKLYRLSEEGLRYWEAWPEEGARATVHEGLAGELGRSWTVDGVDDFETWIADAARPKRAEGFAEIELDEHAVVLVQVPASCIPYPLDEFEAPRHRGTGGGDRGRRAPR